MDDPTSHPRNWYRAVERAHAAWPADWLADADFISYLRERLPTGSDDPAGLAVEDLYLAGACAAGVAEAATAFAAKILPEIDAHVAGMGGGRAFADDVRQVVAARLLAAEPGRAPRISEYAGSAPLSAWVRIVALRVALNLRRGKALAAERHDDAALDALAAGGDGELDLLRRRYGPAVEAALAEALAGLPPRERSILRLRLLDGLEVEAIGRMFRVHRVTVTRWLAACRAQLLADTRRRVAARLGIADREIDSLLVVLRSKLHVSVVRLLLDT